MASYNKESSGFSRYGASDIALMRRRRAQGASFEEIGREFGCSRSVAWHHTNDVSLEVLPEANEVMSSVGNTRAVLDEDVTITVPMSLKPRSMIALWSAAQSAGYDSPDDYIESFLRDRRIERSNKAHAEMEARTNIIAARERPSRQSEPIESIRRTYVEGLELVMLMRGMRGEEPPVWLFPEYYARKREGEARILR